MYNISEKIIELIHANGFDIAVSVNGGFKRFIIKENLKEECFCYTRDFISKIDAEYLQKFIKEKCDEGHEISRTIYSAIRDENVTSVNTNLIIDELIIDKIEPLYYVFDIEFFIRS